MNPNRQMTKAAQGSGKVGTAAPDPSQRAAELREALEDANYRYHVLDAPTIDDAQYDALLRELDELEAANPGS